MSSTLPLPQSDRRSGPYVASGGQVTFSVTFPFLAAGDLRVQTRPTSGDYWTTRALTTEYSVAGVGNTGGGSVTFVTAPGAGVQVQILGMAPVTSQSDVTPAGQISSTGINRMYDRVVMWLQEIRRDATEALDTVLEAMPLLAQVAPSLAQMLSALAQAIVAKDLAQSYAADAAQVSGVEVPIYESRATASGKAIAAGIKRIRLNYYAPAYGTTVSLVGGAQYRRVSFAELSGFPNASYFRSSDYFLPDGTSDFVLGGYWLLAEWAPDITMFGAVADATGSPGVGTDNTNAIHAAIEWCKRFGTPVRVPAGQFRVTSGYTHNAAFQEISFKGEGEVTRNALGVNPSSAIILDSSSSSSFFYRATGSSGIRVSGMTFGCAQEVKDRKFFRFSENQGVKQIFRDVQFVKVEKPVVYEAGSYFQWSSYENVAFRNSGTIHSEVVGVQGQVSTLVGTGLTFMNVSHDGGIPDATDKVVMNLQGIREIYAFNTLLEGAFPSSGWTVLKSDCLYNNGWARMRVATFVGSHLEWSGAASNMTYLLDLGSGRFRFEGSHFAPIAAGSQKIRLNGYAQLEIAGGSFTENAAVINDLFEFNGTGGHVTFEGTTLRVFRPADARFTIRNCTLGITDNAAAEGNAGPSPAYRWTGGIVDGGLLSIVKSGAVGLAYSVDATYGRKMVFTPSGANLLDPQFTTPGSRFAAGDQVAVVGKLKLPVYTTGQIILSLYEASTGLFSVGYLPTFSGQIIDFRLSGRMTGGLGGTVSLRVTTPGSSDLSDVMEVYSLALYKGDDLPRAEHPSHPRNIVTWNSAAPTTGEWARGDVVWNTAPSAAGAPGWVCVTAGTPGTWKAMANLAA